MAHLWTPDTCRNGLCLLEIVDGHRGLVAVRRLCPHHTTMRQSLASDAALFDAVIATNRVKNAAIAAVEADTGTPASDVPFSIGTDDRVTVTVAGNNTTRTRIRAAIDARVGTGKVVVA